MIDNASLTRLCSLAGFSLTDRERDAISHELSVFIDFADGIGSVNTDADASPCYPHDTLNALREDKVEVSTNKDELLASAPSVTDGFISLPSISWEDG